MMTDSEFVMFMGLWILGGLLLLQTLRLWHLRRKFIRLAMDAPKAEPVQVAPVRDVPVARDDDEMDRIKKRLQVLERIATDDNNRLESEFEALRRA